MAYLVLVFFLLVVVGAVWLASQTQGQTTGSGCCAPADPRDDLRMRGAFEDDADFHAR